MSLGPFRGGACSTMLRSSSWFFTRHFPRSGLLDALGLYNNAGASSRITLAYAVAAGTAIVVGGFDSTITPWSFRPGAFSAFRSANT